MYVEREPSTQYLRTWQNHQKSGDSDTIIIKHLLITFSVSYTCTSCTVYTTCSQGVLIIEYLNTHVQATPMAAAREAVSSTTWYDKVCDFKRFLWHRNVETLQSAFLQEEVIVDEAYFKESRLNDRPLSVVAHRARSYVSQNWRTRTICWKGDNVNTRSSTPSMQSTLNSPRQKWHRCLRIFKKPNQLSLNSINSQ